MRLLPKLYAITDARLSGLSHREQVAALSAAGATLIQLRDKTLSSRDFYLEAKEAVDLARPSGARIVINDRVDIALAVGAGGVHLGQNDMPPAQARRLLGERAIIGLSTHNVAQAVEASRLPIDYLAVGPVFGTRTKDRPDPIVGIERLREIRAVIGDLPLVAIGGIDLERASEVFAAGADSAAIVSWLVSPGCTIRERTTQFLSAFG